MMGEFGGYTGIFEIFHKRRSDGTTKYEYRYKSTSFIPMYAVSVSLVIAGVCIIGVVIWLLLLSFLSFLPKQR
jgi:hypothetical protein